MNYKINSINQKIKKYDMSKTVNLSKNDISQRIEKNSNDSNIKKKKKSIIQYVTFIQLWWKTIYQIIKIQKYLRGYLYRIKLLKTLEINQRILYGLIGFSKLLKKIIFHNLIFSIYDMLMNKLKYYLYKWNEIIIKKIITLKLKNYSHHKKITIKKNKTRKDNSAAIKNLIKKINAYREVKKKHFKINTTVSNNKKKLSKGKNVSKYSMLTHSSSKQNTNKSNKKELGRLTPRITRKNMNNEKSSSAEKRILKNNQNKKFLIKNNTNNHSMEKRIKQNKKESSFNKEILNRKYINSLNNFMNSNIKKYMNNIRKKDSFGNCNFLTNISVNASNSKVDSSYLMNYKSFCIDYPKINNKDNKNINKKLLLNSKRAVSLKKSSATMQKRKNNKSILQTYEVNHEKKSNILKNCFIYWNNKTNKKLILVKLLGIFKIIKSIENMQNLYIKEYQIVFFNLLYNKYLIHKFFNKLKNITYLQMIISKLKTYKSYVLYNNNNNINNGEVHFCTYSNNYVYQSNYTPILEISSDDKEKTNNSINSNNIIINERRIKLLSLIDKFNNKNNLSKSRNSFIKWKYIAKNEIENFPQSYIKSVSVNKRNTNNNNSYYLYQPNIQIDSACFEDYLINNKKNFDNNNFMNKTINNYSELTNNNTMSLISNTNPECFNNTLSNNFYDPIYHKKKIVNYKYIANLTKKNIKIKDLSLCTNTINNSIEGIGNSNEININSGRNINTQPINICVYYPKKILINNLRKNYYASKKLSCKTHREKVNINKINEMLKEFRQKKRKNIIDKKNSFIIKKRFNLSKDEITENKLNKSF